jgi:hypothetical protein
MLGELLLTIDLRDVDLFLLNCGNRTGHRERRSLQATSCLDTSDFFLPVGKAEGYSGRELF